VDRAAASGPKSGRVPADEARGADTVITSAIDAHADGELSWHLSNLVQVGEGARHAAG
jgi:hypothetical protein